MTKTAMPLLLLVTGTMLPAPSAGEASTDPDRVVVQSGNLRLRALLWRPAGRGPFPAVLYNHGSGTTLDRQVAQATTVGPVFARHGYAFLFLFRRGSGLSADQGTSAADLLERELKAHGWEARNRLQLRLLETEHLDDALAGLAFLRALPDVDRELVAVAGHSFGGSLTLLIAGRDPKLRAAVAFSGSAGSWARSPPLRALLLAAVKRSAVPVFFVQAANDYSVAPTEELSAEMARIGKRYRVKIYPPCGETAEEGHDFVYRAVSAWEQDVFAFLDERLSD